MNGRPTILTLTDLLARRLPRTVRPLVRRSSSVTPTALAAEEDYRRTAETAPAPAPSPAPAGMERSYPLHIDNQTGLSSFTLSMLPYSDTTRWSQEDPIDMSSGLNDLSLYSDLSLYVDLLMLLQRLYPSTETYSYPPRSDLYSNDDVGREAIRRLTGLGQSLGQGQGSSRITGLGQSLGQGPGQSLSQGQEEGNKGTSFFTLDAIAPTGVALGVGGLAGALMGGNPVVTAAGTGLGALGGHLLWKYLSGNNNAQSWINNNLWDGAGEHMQYIAPALGGLAGLFLSK